MGLNNSNNIYCQVWTVDGCQSFTWEQWKDFDVQQLLDKDGSVRIYLLDQNYHWYQNGKRHRTNGPAYIEVNGYREWWLNGQFLPKNHVEDWLRENNIDLKTIEGQTAFVFRWS